ncbi:MAG: AbrB/MazE/SpoVT family DNA-binding domain-containing protein [Mariprofundus sp.]|nr:AbrB/MazE/SpoVT family DNA-binding domain-containing protein [Mariprofundus sp.]
MHTVTVSPKFQIVIPSTIRRSLDIHSGEKLEVIPYRGRIELVPVREMKSMRGFLQGIDTTIEREGDRI